jgi:hypothetical protein
MLFWVNFALRKQEEHPRARIASQRKELAAANMRIKKFFNKLCMWKSHSREQAM